MKKFYLSWLAAFTVIASAANMDAQVYTFQDFVGTWHGTISSSSFGGYNDPITMTIEGDGFYTESSGHLMPSIYPNTQECDFDAATNRMHWWYLQTVYAGIYTYQHFFYEVVYFQNDTLELHYNFTDDPSPQPEAGTIFLVKESANPAPSSLQAIAQNNNIELNWEVPAYGNAGLSDPDGYHIYYSMNEEPFELLVTVSHNNFTHENITIAGQHNYYVTAYYNDTESSSSNFASVLLTTPEPTELVSHLFSENVSLNWEEPSDLSNPMAELLGYNIYHKMEGENFMLLAYTENNYFAHQNISEGIHYYYVTAVYNGGESSTSNNTSINYSIASINDNLLSKTNIYPNPASDVLNIRAEYEIQSLFILDQIGRVVYQNKTNALAHGINVSSLHKGIYILKIVSREGKVSKQILID